METYEQLINHLSLKQLKQVEELVRSRLHRLEIGTQTEGLVRQEEKLHPGDVLYDQTLEKWFTLAKAKLPSYGQLHSHSTNCYKVALTKTFSELKEKEIWRNDMIESDYHNIRNGGASTTISRTDESVSGDTFSRTGRCDACITSSPNFIQGGSKETSTFVPNIPCDNEECWYKNNLDKFDGTIEVQVSVFCDVNLGDTMTLCTVCCENGEKESF